MGGRNNPNNVKKAFHEVYFKNENRHRYCLVNGFVTLKVQGITYNEFILGTNIKVEDVYRDRKSVPEEHWNDWVEMMTYIHNPENNGKKCNIKIAEIVSRGNIPEGGYECDINYNNDII